MKREKIRHSLKKIVGGGYTTYWRCYDRRYIVIKGSRGSKKSKTTALRFIWLMMKLGDKALDEGTDAFPSMVVIRRYWNTHRDSTRAELVWAIEQLGATSDWNIPKGDLTLTYKPTGQKILFRGMDDVQSITSITVSVGYLCFVWFEEFFQVTNEGDFDKVDMSIRGRLPDGLFHQIVMTFNPWSDRHFVKRKFFDTPDDDVLALTTTYKCNEFLSEKDIARYEKMRVQNPRRYQIEGLGEWGIAEGLIFENWKEEDFDINELIEKNRNKRTERGLTAFVQCCGMDFGYTDANAFIASYADRKDYKIYIYYEFYEVQMENRKIASKLIQDGFQDAIIRADSEDPRTINELRLLGLHGMRPVKKGAGSVLGGIQKLQDFEIIVHPRCQHMIESLSNYAWSKDRLSGAILPVPEHDFSHACVTGDMLVNTVHGKKPIKDLIGKREKVYSYNLETGRIEVQECFNAQVTRKQQEIYEIELTDGQKIKCTADHRILTDRGYVECKDLTDCDRVICKRIIHIYELSYLCYNVIKAFKERCACIIRKVTSFLSLTA